MNDTTSDIGDFREMEGAKCELNIPASIIEKMGGNTKAARTLGHQYPTTVAYWAKSGSIPKWRRQAVVIAAAGLRLDLSDEEVSYLSAERLDSAAEIAPGVSRW